MLTITHAIVSVHACLMHLARISSVLLRVLHRARSVSPTQVNHRHSKVHICPCRNANEMGRTAAICLIYLYCVAERVALLDNAAYSHTGSLVCSSRVRQ